MENGLTKEYILARPKNISMRNQLTHSVSPYLLETYCMQALCQELIVRTRHSDCPHGVYIFQDYWEIRIEHKQPGIALAEKVQHLGF